MPKAIHCLCHNDGPPLGFRLVHGVKRIHKSGFWIVGNQKDISALIEHGWLYLHHAGRLGSWFAGVVLAAEQMVGTDDPKVEGKWEFTVHERGLPPKPWRGPVPRQNAVTHARIVECEAYERNPIIKPERPWTE